MALPMNVSGLRRNIKNIAHNYTDAQVKVREATSNDPWGPSSTIMSEIADLTYNVVAFSEIMQMVWKRLNDHGKNWRHVYKALVLLEYLIKTGSEKVAEQSRENIHSISTLKDFQYIEEGKDQGINVREKAKAMVALLKDDERLKNERVRALKAKERFAQSVSGMASDPDINSPTSPSYPGTLVTSSSRTERDSYGVRERPTDYGELESARPHTVGEEELQLQLALAMSKEEADHGEARRRSDDVRLQMALNESKDEKSDDGSLLERQARQEQKDRSGINDLLDINFNPPQNNGALLGAVGGLGLGSPLSPPSAARDPWGLSPPGPAGSADPQVDPWGVAAPQPPAVSSPPLAAPPKVDPWGAAPSRAQASPAPVATTLAPDNDPWSPTPPAPPAALPPTATAANDPWAPVPAPAPASDPWAAVKSPSPLGAAQPDPFAPLPPQQPALDDFSVLTNREKPAANDAAFNLSGLDDALSSASRASPAKSRSPASFLGESSNLVNLDNLVASKSSAAGMASSSALSSSSPNLNVVGVGKSYSPFTAQPNTALFSSTRTLNTPNTNPFTAFGLADDSAVNNNNNNNNNNVATATVAGSGPYGLTSGVPNAYRSMSPLPTAVNGLGTSHYSPSPPLTLTNTLNNNNVASIPPLSQDSFTGANPFSGSVMSGAVGGLGGAGGGASGIVPNPFQAAQSPKPSINQLRASAVGGFNDPWGAAPHNNGIDGLTSKGSDPF